ncbi:MAG TPA: 3'(2'),5'-bisphosphate nucleotidase CysQ [Nevskiaceae bacterium]
MDLPALLDRCTMIAAEAGAAIMKVYATDFVVRHKEDDSPLTQADVAAHRIIADALGKLEPRLPCLSEEGAHLPFAERSQWRRYWLVDPLDGTREFVKRNGEFTVNIALIVDDRPVLGVIYAPVTKALYCAVRGQGSWRTQAGVRAALHTRTVPAEPSLLVSKSHRSDELDALLAHAPPHVENHRGSSLKFCLIAAGEADLYPRTGATCEWDTAAGQCIVEQAGGAVLSLSDWSPLRYNQKESLINPSFVAVGDPRFGWREYLHAGT